MPRARHQVLVDKSIDACLAAIEIYNKPDFRYREETFAILMLNSWELLLKARILAEEGNTLRSIEVWEPRINKDGSKSKRQTPKRNRSGNTMTIDLTRAAGLVQSYKVSNIDVRCAENLRMLMEVRDNAIHLHNVSAGLGKRIQEVGSATLRNYVGAAEEWFGVDMSTFNFYLMPLTFHSPTAVLESMTSKHEPAAGKNLLDYIANMEGKHPSDESKVFNVTLQLELRFVRTSGADAVPVRVSKDPSAVTVHVSEEDIRRTYPWDYPTLIRKLKERYSDLVQNQDFYKLKGLIEGDERYCRVRFFDPAKPKSGRKSFYSPNIIAEFDKHYTRP